MKKIPISLIIDDPAPVLSVYYTHAGKETTGDGRPLIEYYPNELLHRFCDIAEKRDLKGKFSVVPMPGNRGDILNGISGVDPADMEEWLRTVRTRLTPRFTVGPEMLTHNLAVDLATGGAFDMNEQHWAADKDRAALTPYIARALEILKAAGFDVYGVTSPWAFGIEAEEEYAAAISKAVFDVTGKTNAWYFLRGLRNVPDAKPWVQLREEGRCLVSIPATTDDVIWCSIDTDDQSDEFVRSRADLLITADGKDGQIIRVLETGGWPILISHWQSLMSNGLGTGLRILDEAARRIEEHLSDRVEWMSFAEIMEMVAADPDSYPRPCFND
ncbi:MAG: hypothetical protein IKM31_04630 [Oscillospiraceae bacterium]|nr:hypothetical protein [Oscillospiraceae bacterium]